MANLLRSFFTAHSDKHTKRQGDTIGQEKGHDDAYVSEYTGFITHYLESHPEVVEDQRYGRLIWWDQQVDLDAWKKSQEDSVPEDGYGFYYQAWLGQTDPKARKGEENPEHPNRDQEALNG